MASEVLKHVSEHGLRAGQLRASSAEHSAGVGPKEQHAEPWVSGSVGAARITKVGLWLTLLTLVLSVAAANTGNNSLYLLIAGTTSLLVVAWWAARANVRGHELAIQVPDEIYAGAPTTLLYRVRRRAGGRSTDLLLLIKGSKSGSLLRRLDGQVASRWGLGRWTRPRHVGGAHPGTKDELAGARVRGEMSPGASGEQQILFLRRGVHPLGQAKVLSLFPMGLFRRQVSFKSATEVIVLPEIFSGLRTRQSRSPRGWRHTGSRVGRSEDLHSLRDWRSGDDPRSIHWKQSARNSRLIFQERSEDEARRVSIAVDSVVPADVASDDQRFERLVSEAATACVKYLEQGYEVELILREGSIGFGAGAWQRRRVLEALALLQWQVGEGSELRDLGFAASDSRDEGHVLRFSLSRSPSSEQGAPS